MKAGNIDRTRRRKQMEEYGHVTSSFEKKLDHTFISHL